MKKSLANLTKIGLFCFFGLFAQASLMAGRITARDIERHLRSMGPWVEDAKTVDTFKAGDPDREVKSIAVSWMSTLRALKEAQARGCQLFVTHEPTFYSHYDNDSSFAFDRSMIEKQKFLQETGMVVYRCHDVWDRVPKIGILESWAGALGFKGKPIAEKLYYSVFEIPETTVEKFGREIAPKLEPYGQEAVQVVGDLSTRIRKIAIGTGAITNAKEMHDLGADAAVITEVTYWKDVRWAQDMGFPLFIVEHSVSECPGLENLAGHLSEKFPGVRVEYIQEGCPFRLIGPEGLLTR